ncbi:MAG: hypothetical protein ACI9MC_003588 [Kiritimatiellia bacterium]
MLDRLMGTETEYAIRYGAAPGGSDLGRDVIYDKIIEAVKAEVAVTPASGLVNYVRKRFFTANGGAIYYEHQPQWPEAGLVEGATPECRGPGDLLRYQRAQDRLLERAIRRVQQRLPDGAKIGLRKNARDVDGNIYGPQESYEAEIASGWRLALWRLGVLVLIPWIVVAAVLLWLLMFVVIAVLLVSTIVVAMFSLGDAERALEAWQRRVAPASQNFMEFASHVVLGPAFIGLSLMVRALAWRSQRHALVGLLASRSVISGAGTLLPDGRLVLCEKVYGLARTIRWTATSSDRAIFEIGHLMKQLSEPMWLRPSKLGLLIGRRQRLQLSLSDSNRCDVAEYLKLATTALVLDMAEAGLLQDAPVPIRPLQAARQISDDPDLKVHIDLKDGTTMSALQIQRFYQARAKTFVEASDVSSLPAVELVQLWGDVLDALERDPDELIGQIDWVSKRALLRRAEDQPGPVRKRIDLGYHDLVDGYHASLDQAGLVRRLVEDDEIDRAIVTPPSDSPAGLRGRLVQQGATRVDWNRAKLGGKVIRIDSFRKRK